jgi:hypothetical protein
MAKPAPRQSTNAQEEKARRAITAGAGAGLGLPPSSSPTGGDAALEEAFQKAISNSSQAQAANSYDAQADIYGLGVQSSTPVRFRSTLARSGSRAELVSSYDDPNAPRNATGTVGSQLQRLYQMGPQELAMWQRKLFEGGFYANGMEWTDIIPGVVDEQTDRAWYRATISAARSVAAGQNVSLEDVIDNSAMALNYQGSGSGGGGGAAPYQPTRLSDPAGLRAMMDQISGSLIGRRLTDDEKAKLVAQIHGAETNFYGQVRGQASVLTDVNPQAQIQESVEKDFKPEFDATQVANTFGMFEQIIGGSRRGG